MRYFDKLSAWIQPQHLEASCIEALKNRPPQEFVNGIVLDNFMKPEILDRLHLVLSDEALLTNRYQLVFSDDHGSVSEEAFFNAPESSRIAWFLYVSGVKPEYLMSRNWITYLKFLNFYAELFPRFLEAFSGYRLSKDYSSTHAQRYEHFLKKHSDVRGKRRICTVLYLSPDWQPEFGGALHLCLENGEEKMIDAVHNRLVIFYPGPETVHYVGRHTEQALDKSRDCHVAWYCDVE